MSPDRRMMKCRQDAAVALQKLVFRAQQQNGFVTIEDCLPITDLITVSVIESFSQYLSINGEQNEFAN